MGIVNGTTNYILDRMDREGSEFADVLADAQRSATPRPTRRPMSRATTRRRRPRSSRRSRSTRPCLDAVHREGITAIDRRRWMRARARLRHQAARRVRADHGCRGESPTGEAISVRVYPR
jgi:homoserine dehydrogenase